MLKPKPWRVLRAGRGPRESSSLGSPPWSGPPASPPWSACCDPAPIHAQQRDLLKIKPTRVPPLLSTLQWLASHTPRKETPIPPHLARNDLAPADSLTRSPLLAHTARLRTFALAIPFAQINLSKNSTCHGSVTMPLPCQACPRCPG